MMELDICCGTGEAEAGRLSVESQSVLHKEFGIGLNCIVKPCLKKYFLNGDSQILNFSNKTGK